MPAARIKILKSSGSMMQASMISFLFSPAADGQVAAGASGRGFAAGVCRVEARVVTSSKIQGLLDGFRLERGGSGQICHHHEGNKADEAELHD